MENLKWVLRRLLPHTPLIALSIAGSIMQSAGATSITLLVKNVVDEVFIIRDYPSLIKTVLLILGSAVLMQSGYFIAKYTIVLASEKTLLSLREELFTKLMRVHYSFFIKHPAGDLISRIVNDIERIKGILTDQIPVLLREPFVAVGLVGVLLYRDSILAVLLLIALPVMAYMVKFFGRKKGKHTKRTQEGMADLTQILSQTLMGVENIKVFSAENRVMEAFRNFNRRIFKASVKSEFYITANTALNYTFGYTVVAGVFFYGGYRIINGALTPGDFVSFLTALFLIQPPLLATQKSLMGIKGNLPIVSRLKEVLELEEERGGTKTFSGLREWISFRDVSVEVEGKNILQNINLEIKRGEKLGIVGQTGSGKSTLVKIVPRLIDYKGSVSLDGTELKDFELVSLRSSIGMSTQENFLINASIKENVLIAKPGASDKEVLNALELAVCDFVWELERGIDTVVGERGFTLSGGERQRIALARVFLKNPDIVILDEATSALDLATEKRVLKNIREFFADKTLLIVAHRITNISDCDRIIVLKEGRIVEEGTFYSLIEKRGEFYKIFQQGKVI